MASDNFGRHLSCCWEEGGRKTYKDDITFNEMKVNIHNLGPSTC